MAFHRKDHFYKQAKEEGLRSRAAYKLEELHKRFQIFPKGGRVLDLGAARGGWLQSAAYIVGPSGRIDGIDLLVDLVAGRANVVCQRAIGCTHGTLECVVE